MYEVFIICDREECNSRVQVPQPGALPTGWLGIQWQRAPVHVAMPGPNQADPQQGRELVTSMFCSWKCAMHFAKGFLTGN